MAVRVLRLKLSDFFSYIAVQTIASPFGGFSLSRSGCFRLPPVAHLWASKSIRETFTSAHLFYLRTLTVAPILAPQYYS